MSTKEHANSACDWEGGERTRPVTAYYDYQPHEFAVTGLSIKAVGADMPAFKRAVL